jgi:hypothetical protein
MSATEYTRGFLAGYQQAAFDSYAMNLIATHALDIAADYPDCRDRVLVELETALAHHARWADWPDGEDHLIRGED